jgi:hypothetical protein
LPQALSGIKSRSADKIPDSVASIRDIKWKTTVADERARNIHVHDGITEDEFARMRTARDATLSTPRLIIPSIQVNMRAGRLPPTETGAQRFLKVPLNAL